MKANRASGVRVYDAESVARKMRRTFVDRPVEREERYDFDWPSELQNLGDSLAVAYASDKWKPRDRFGKRELELYKHLAESRNQAFAVPGLLVDYNARDRRWPVRGPMVSFESDKLEMPSHFAMLGLFEEIDLKLYTAGTDRAPKFGKSKDAGVVNCKVRHGYLGGSMMRHEGSRMQPFLFVFTKADGVLIIVVGEELDVEKDGIVG